MFHKNEYTCVQDFFCKKASEPLGNSSLNVIMCRLDIFKVSHISWDFCSHFLIISFLSLIAPFLLLRLQVQILFLIPFYWWDFYRDCNLINQIMFFIHGISVYFLQYFDSLVESLLHFLHHLSYFIQCSFANVFIQELIFFFYFFESTTFL